MRFYSLILLVLFPILSFSQGIDNQYIEDYLIKWKNSKEYMITLVESMPEELMTYKPNENSQSFTELTVHIISNMVWLSSDYLGGSGFENEFKNRDFSKDELIEVLAKAFDYAYKTVEKTSVEKLTEEQSFFAGPMTGFQILRLMNDHCTHHKGQLTLHLKMNNIAIPRYVGW
jgi:uncharacterized damage-inducible protein DinB